MDEISRTQSRTSSDRTKMENSKVQQVDEYPDGGSMAWLAAVGATACLFVSFGWVNIIDIFQEYYQSNQLRNYTPSDIAWIPSLQIFFMFAGGIFAGKVFDDYGPHYLLIAGTFWHILRSVPSILWHWSGPYESRPLPYGLVQFYSSTARWSNAFTSYTTLIFLTGGMFIRFTSIVADATVHGMSPHLAQYLICILNATSIFGRTVPNAIADKVGHFNVIIVMGALTSILILGLWLPSTGNAPIILFAALFGVSSGAGISLTPALCAKLSPVQDIGVRTGTIFTISAFAGLTGSPISGAIISDSGGSFANAIAFGGAAGATGTMLFVVCRIAFVGWRPAKI
ncbi:hypothetical protein DL765_001098 [Monosporascus sp. GIB2]|nr:hypothetical protein DL765_001098 [Monosporascus sp. GIB2]